MTRQVARIMPLALSTTTRRIGYLRTIVAGLGLLDGHPPPVDLQSALTRAVFFRGATLEFTLMRAADGMLLWGDLDAATILLERAAVEGAPHARFVTGYLQGMPGLLKERLELGDHDAAARYRAAVPTLLQRPVLAALADGQLRELSAGPADSADTS
jgi:hypothetical protein